MQSLYESDKLLAEYLLFHFGDACEILPADREWPAGMREALDFAVRTPGHFSSQTVARGLDLGCAVGRSAFEMSRACGEVIGIDFSHAFIRAAETLRGGEAVPYERREESAITTSLTAFPPQGIDGSKLRFLQGDAMDLPPGLGVFDRVHAANLLCRLPRPRLLLDRLPDLVRTGGELVLATPCTWLEDFTPAENWPPGTTFDWLVEALAPAFELIRAADEPFLIRETARKFQWSQSMVTVWKRRS
jgi:putative 4-mercaptohistidine N1-methyltranferase